MLNIEEEHIRIFEKIKKQFLPKTKVPKEDNWRSKTNNEIWLGMVKQVIVVGNSKPSTKFEQNAELKNLVSYEELVKIEDQEEIKRIINRVLRAVGTRYASSDFSKCKKTGSLAHNLRMLKSSDGIKGLVKRLSDIKGEDAERRRIERMMRFKYIKNKCSRDFLMELGLVRNAVGLDDRIQKIFGKVGIELPKGCISNRNLYNEIEKDILTGICEPLNLLGVEFDRMLYQNKDDIMKMS